MRQDKAAVAGIGMAVLSSASFGTTGSFARSLSDAGWSSSAAVAVRIGLAALILTIPALFSLRGRRHVLRRNIGMVTAYGLIAVAGGQVFLVAAKFSRLANFA